MVCEGTSVRTYLGHSSNLVTVSVSVVHFYVCGWKFFVFLFYREWILFVLWNFLLLRLLDCLTVWILALFILVYHILWTIGDIFCIVKNIDIPDRDLRVLYVITFISMEFIWYMMCLSHCGFWKQQRRNMCNGLFRCPLTWLGRLVWCLKILKAASQGR